MPGINVHHKIMMQAHWLVLPEEVTLVRLLGIEDRTCHNSTVPHKPIFFLVFLSTENCLLHHEYDLEQYRSARLRANSPTNKLAYNLSARLRRRVHSSNVCLL